MAGREEWMQKVLGHRWAVIIRGTDGNEYAWQTFLSVGEAKSAMHAAAKVEGDSRVRVAPVEIVEEG